MKKKYFFFLISLLIALDLMPPFASGKDSDNATINVKSFGAKGDGITDDTDAIQAAIDAMDFKGGTLIFPMGTYIVTSVGIKPGIHYLGYGARIKRPPMQGEWVRTFNAAKDGYRYSGYKDSYPLTIEGFIFDGNMEEQGAYDNYELEHAALIFLSADKSKIGRLKACVHNCTFQNCVADGLSVYTNVELQVSDCRATDCFRGGLVITGGNTSVQVVNLITGGKTNPTGIDVEVKGQGFGNTRKIELTVNGMFLSDGDFDIAVEDESVVLLNNVIAEDPFYIYGGGTSTFKISNSVFGIGEINDKINRIVRPGSLSFNNCSFCLSGKSDDKQRYRACARIFWNISEQYGPPFKDQSVKFLDCDFKIGNMISTNDVTYAVYTEADKPGNNNMLIIDGGIISSGFDYGVYLRSGGNVTLRDFHLNSDTGLFLDSRENYTFNVLVDGLTFNGKGTYALINSQNEKNKLTHQNFFINEKNNLIKSKSDISKNTYLGGRVIIGREKPASTTQGLLNDIYRLEKPEPGNDYEWICTKTGINGNAKWIPLKQIGN